MDNQAFSDIISEKCPELPLNVREKIVLFRNLIVSENEIQNLTRLVTPNDFYEGHLIDVLELLRAGFCTFPALDLGSGCGVPGILAALLADGNWTLAESEGRKAEFLLRAVDALELGARVKVYSGRAETFLLNEKVGSVVCRAVGSIERVMGWIGKCSTWNKTILFKGPKWIEEWENFKTTKYAKDLVLEPIHEYTLPTNGAKRVILSLHRVPRGTK